MTTKFVSIVVLVTFVIMAPNALAVPPHSPDLITNGNKWIISSYRDASPFHLGIVKQCLCFSPDAPFVVGTHQRYTWYSCTFPGWHGKATQEGDQVFMHGDYARNEGHDAMQWEIVTQAANNTEGAGHWMEWRETPTGYGKTIEFSNAKFVRSGKCATPQAGTAAGAVDNVPSVKEDGTPLDIPITPEGNPLLLPNGAPVGNPTAPSLLPPE